MSSDSPAGADPTGIPEVRAPGDVARIGPSAILRLVEALDHRFGRPKTEAVFRAAGQPDQLATLPDAMVDERSITALYTSLPTQLGCADAAEVSAHAGLLTGEYLLAHRIPAAAQRLMKLMPAALAARTLLAAIDMHSWTFAGSGTFERQHVERAGGGGRSSVYWRLSIANCPLCRGAAFPEPACAYYAATFERIFREVVATSARVAETECQANGAAACVFEVSW
jgi:divinyl protochlorophyllide a 8-vinyl-reductase